MNPPVGNKTLVLPPPEDGKRFTEAVLLATKEKVHLVSTPCGFRITIEGEWDQRDTVIRLTRDESMPFLTSRTPSSYTWHFAEPFLDIWSITDKNKMCDTDFKWIGDDYAMEYACDQERIQLNGDFAMGGIDIRRYRTLRFELLTLADSDIQTVTTDTILGAPGLLRWEIRDKYNDRTVMINKKKLTPDGQYTVTEIALDRVVDEKDKIARIYVHLKFDKAVHESFYIRNIVLC